MTLTIAGFGVVTDSYGTVSPTGVDVELGDGAHPGWYTAWTTTGPEIGVTYDLTVSPVVPLVLSSTDDCRDGGYARYDFKNQGLYIASLQANGRPAQ